MTTPCAEHPGRDDSPPADAQCIDVLGWDAGIAEGVIQQNDPYACRGALSEDFSQRARHAARVAVVQLQRDGLSG